MAELLKTVKPIEPFGKKTSNIYRTITWEKRAKAIFFYLHSSLGNRDPDLTYSVFSPNLNTFSNWLRQNQYYGKWLHYVESFAVSDILPEIPLNIRQHYASVDPESKVEVESKFKDKKSDKVYVSAASSGSRQLNKFKSTLSDSVFYIRKTTKSGSGRNIKHQARKTLSSGRLCKDGKWEIH